MFRTTRNYSLILVAACVFGGRASAQSADVARPVTSDSVVASDARVTAPTQAGPRIDATAVAVRQHSQVAAAADSYTLQRGRSNSMGQPVALMVVGGAAIVLGAVIGGDVGTLFMIGGSVSVLIGLYQYLK